MASSTPFRRDKTSSGITIQCAKVQPFSGHASKNIPENLLAEFHGP
jgi:hypothetical protein